MLHPDLAGEWHPWMNRDLRPEAVSSGDLLSAWWLCPSGHPYQAPVRFRTMFKSGCPVCDGKRIRPGVNDLASVSPELAAQWDVSKNGDLSPELVSPGYKQDVWWRPECGHEFERSPSARRQDGRCPVCVGRRVYPGQNDLASQRPDLASQWHPRLNGTLTPERVGSTARTRAVWMRPCGHSYRATVAQRVADPSFPLCVVCQPPRPVRETSSVSTRPELMALWDWEANAELNPATVRSGDSRLEIGWRCERGHVWQRPPLRQRGYCRICTNEDFVPGINDLGIRNPDLARQWHPERNGSLTPRDVPVMSNKSVWWMGPCGHEWRAVVSNRSLGAGCRHRCQGVAQPQPLGA